MFERERRGAWWWLWRPLLVGLVVAVAALGWMADRRADRLAGKLNTLDAQMGLTLRVLIGNGLLEERLFDGATGDLLQVNARGEIMARIPQAAQTPEMSSQWVEPDEKEPDEKEPDTKKDAAPD